jgi:hypothetical protein
MEYMSDLLEKDIGHSRDKQHWINTFGSTPKFSVNDKLDEPMDWKEIHSSLETLAPNKAASINGILA